jgi:hypothetical protein
LSNLICPQAAISHQGHFVSNYLHAWGELLLQSWVLGSILLLYQVMNMLWGDWRGPVDQHQAVCWSMDGWGMYDLQRRDELVILSNAWGSIL